MPKGTFRHAELVLRLLTILECHEPLAYRVSLALLAVRASFLDMQRLVGVADAEGRVEYVRQCK